MKINKITTGFVIQTYDTKTGRCVGQEFVAGDDVKYEDQNGEAVDWSEKADAYQPFDMAQAGRKAQHYNLLVQGGTEAVVLGPFDTPEKRIKAARRTWRKEARPGQDNLFKLDVDEKGVPTVHEYVGELEDTE